MNFSSKQSYELGMIIRICCLILILGALAPLTGAPKDKPEFLVEKYDNGKTKLRVAIVDGKWHGPLKRFEKTGKIAETATYFEGQLDGKRRLYKAGKPVNEELWSMDELLFPVTKAFFSKKISKIRNQKAPKGTDRRRISALRELQVYRFICHMPWKKIRLTDKSNDFAEHAAEICAAHGRLNHHPKNPGWEKSKFVKGADGARHSNLAMASAWAKEYVKQIKLYIDDGRTPSLGHRRHCLNPILGEVGFGAKGNFAAMYWGGANDTEIGDWTVQSLPTKGLTPKSLFDPSWDWHVAWNTKHYRCPDDKAIKVEVRPVLGKPKAGVPWRKGLRTGKPIAFRPARVDRSGVGPPCVIFRPKNPPSLKLFLIRVSGMQDSTGKATTIEILSEFVG